MLPVAQQMRIITSDIADLVPEAELVRKLERGRPLRVKLGVDPTAPDLHLGHAVQLRKLRQFQDLGHTVVLIIGDFTALIGDPSGRNTTRPPLLREQIDENARTYVEQAFKVLDVERTQLVRNSAWLEPLRFADILRLTGQFTVARILDRDDFQQRFKDGVGISLHELLYPIAQAYDSVAVRADVELGGTDQLFNLLAGRDLMEKSGMEPQVALTMPLLEGTDGVQKMSKSYGNYIGLTDEPSDMFGKVMSIPDGIMVKYYRLCAGLSPEDAERLERELIAGTKHPRTAKRELARRIVALYHCEEAAVEAEKRFDAVFVKHEIPSDVPEAVMVLADETYLPGVMVEAGLASSAGEARRLIDGGGVRIDGQSVPAGEYTLARARLDGVVVQVGKRRFIRVRGSG